jgi:molybdopterin converting factor small subunit
MFSVLVFGPMAEAAGAKQLTIHLAGDCLTCSALRYEIQRQYPQLATMLRSCRFAVNCAFAEEARELDGTEEVALIGLVAGG